MPHWVAGRHVQRGQRSFQDLRDLGKQHGVVGFAESAKLGKAINANQKGLGYGG
jgi:hypothetical protein